ncbi:hypothetical protein M409DRAFT_54964 [Zasmidium cellare ATCC 36951]|uniref:Uncharacterized protein n=1 Tax=Zasmidium cellare ATCC 36951 TaxID=1080233 RepID=A0A6A6CLP0_ZASCE|nr:uncharacterized protein M409DRAFT_54964 [Zasmidium cellare ATCC 36951]KAF2166639.1 hypothetical protein M409DRAFT_54964 [Zasmidium cellare ATCC 36951]
MFKHVFSLGLLLPLAFAAPLSLPATRSTTPTQKDVSEIPSTGWPTSHAAVDASSRVSRSIHDDVADAPASGWPTARAVGEVSPRSTKTLHEDLGDEPTTGWLDRRDILE